MEGFSYVIKDFALLPANPPFMVPAMPVLIAVGYTKSEALRNFDVLMPKLGEDAPSQHDVYFVGHEFSDAMVRHVKKANRMLGSVQITSVSAIMTQEYLDEDEKKKGRDVGVIRVLASEDRKERVVYQEGLVTRAKSLLTTIENDYFEKLADAVHARF